MAATPTRELSGRTVPEYHKIVITSTSHPVNEESIEAAFNVLRGFQYREKYNRHFRKEWNFPEQLDFKRQVRADPHAFINPTIDTTIDPNAEVLWGDDGLVRVPSLLPDQKVINYDEFKVDLYDFYHKIVLGKKENTFAVRRLKLIEQNYTMHHILNEGYEDNEASKDTADFYKIVKVDNHIHAAGAMTIQDMLQFIQDKIREEPDVVVTKDEKTLKEVLDGFEIPTVVGDIHQLSTDVLGMQAGPKMFHRFDHFNDAYNPFGKADLRTIFMKTSNHIDGRYFAEITKNFVFKRCMSKHTTAQAMEPRLSIYGFGMEEWTNLAKFFNAHEMGRCSRVKWMIQVPRLAKIFMGIKFKNFGELLQNIFDPMVQATLYPDSHPDLHILLSNIGGFDSVDDESEYDSFLVDGDSNPFNFTTKANPPYSYWMFMMSENLKTVNQLREKRGMNIFSFAPHCGESGQKHHCASAFLTSDMINHGVKVNKMPVLTYVACHRGVVGDDDDDEYTNLLSLPLCFLLFLFIYSSLSIFHLLPSLCSLYPYYKHPTGTCTT